MAFNTEARSENKWIIIYFDTPEPDTLRETLTSLRFVPHKVLSNGHHHLHVQWLSLLARSILKYLWGLWVTLFLLEQVTSLLQNPLSWRTKGFYSGFSSFRFLPWLTNPAYPPRNPGKGPLPGATDRASGTWREQGRHSLQLDCLFWEFQFAIFVLISNL
jgi:hypothetical protein